MKTILIKITTTNPNTSAEQVLQMLKDEFPSAEVTEIKSENKEVSDG